MLSDLRQESFTHAKCFSCKHLAAIDKFSPEMVPIEECKTVDIKITENIGNITLSTVQCKCPMCGSFNVEVLFPSEVN